MQRVSFVASALLSIGALATALLAKSTTPTGAGTSPATAIASTADSSPDPIAAAPEFLLDSAKGERISLYAERPGRLATAIAFLAENCPVSKAYGATLSKLAKEYAEQGIVFLAVDVSPLTDAKKAQAFAKAAALDLPLLLDPMVTVAQRYDVTKAATVVLLDAEFRPVYRGAIDDQHSTAGSKPRASNDWLVEAMESLIAHEEVSIESGDGSGAELTRTVPSEVNFNEHVAPILHRQCADCHRPGQVAPMALLDYDDAKGYAPQIAEVTGNGRMPPWHADPRYGHFENERRLTETEKAILARWVETGSKQGDPKKKPKTPVYKDDGWAMGKPDMIFQLPEPEQIPADGYVDYRYKLVDPQLKEDVWVQSVELRPTAQDATHHVLALYVPPGKMPLAALSGLQDGSLAGAGYFAVQVPGCRPNLFPEGAGKKIEKGAKFLFQLHYTPNGKATTDQTRMGIRLCKTPPKIEVKTRGVFSTKLRIPANDPHAVATSEWTFKKPTRLISMFPHMHTRGSAFKFEKIAGKGEDAVRTVICDVPKYDFNWQNFYLPIEPVQFDAGDTIFCTAAYDNSKGNPFNPDPNRSVTWGDQTFEEMMIGYIDYIEVE